MGFFRITPQGLVLEELASGISIEQVRQATAANLKVSEDVKTWRI
jgi:acyl CoA:acetate/3-ketoacid CoA transferase beta subunit